ncbi:hypothetical protein Sjap_020326 [Stephania japonica]|uniref:Uncharacterized protein n=1 Tax=Stephania japonica TaxID=461633 RepID=A0AAP0F389_9MAGN
MRSETAMINFGFSPENQNSKDLTCHREQAIASAKIRALRRHAAPDEAVVVNLAITYCGLNVRAIIQDFFISFGWHEITHCNTDQDSC